MKTKFFIPIFFTLIFILSAVKILSQPVEGWVNGNSTPRAGTQDIAAGIVLANDGNVCVVGSSNAAGSGFDIVLTKINASSGETMWERTWSGPGANYDKALSVTSDNSFLYITGVSFQPSGDIVTLKYDFNGNLAWARTYDGPRHGGDFGTAIKTDANGNVFVTGRSAVGERTFFTTIKYNSDGVQQWASAYNGPLANNWDEAQAIAVDMNGSVYVTGYTSDYKDFRTADYLTVKYDMNGNLVWAQRYNGTGNSEDIALSIVEANRSIYVTGKSDSAGGNSNFYTIKYASATGDVQASVSYTGVGLRQIDHAIDMAKDDAGFIYVAGYSFNATNEFDLATVKYSPNLEQLWAISFDAGGDDIPSKIVTSSDNVYVVGTSKHPRGTAADFVTLKYKNTGEKVWDARFNSPFTGYDHGVAIAIDGSQNVYVTGDATSSATSSNLFTVQYINSGSVSDLSENGKKPAAFELRQNHPNPFNPSTNISFNIPNETVEKTQLIIYDVLGRQVQVLVNQHLTPGTYSVNWDASRFSSGVYFYKLISGSNVKTNKMILLE
jgi:methionine-rich copper-binding protein CopC